MVNVSSTSPPELSTPAVPKLEIAIADGSPTDRHRTDLVLASWGHSVIGRAATSAAALDMVSRRRPQVALVGRDLADISGIQLVHRLLAASSDLGVVLVLERPSADELEDAAGSGARGILLRSGDVSELATAVAIVAEGGRYVSPEVERRVRTLTEQSVLSPSEREVLQLLADGMTGVQAAVRLAVPPETVRSHVRDAMRKLRARTRAQAVALAIKRHEIWS
jgi:DNA-binding NarL/FixJ family response regulator